jgi:hypothetical protein
MAVATAGGWMASSRSIAAIVVTTALPAAR